MEKDKFLSQLRQTPEIMDRTELFIEWLNLQSDDVKQQFALNWRIAHSLFNVACKLFKSEDIQGINWYYIYKIPHLIKWSHGGSLRPYPTMTVKDNED